MFHLTALDLEEVNRAKKVVENCKFIEKKTFG